MVEPEEMVSVLPEPSVRLLLNLTQPVLGENGQLRWALNNVAFLLNPPCTPLGVHLQR